MTGPYTSERVIGHHLRAEVPEPSRFSKQLDELAERLDIERSKPDRIRITESDIGWDESKSVTLTRQELHEIAEHFPL